LSVEEANLLSLQLEERPLLTASEIVSLDLSAKNRVEALLQVEFLGERQLGALACDFAEHTLYIFDEHARGDRRPHQCVEAARRYYLEGGSLEELNAAISEAVPAVWRLEKTVFVGAFTAGLAATFLDNHDAAVMVRHVANHTQRAIHYKEWESRESDLELMFGREIGATWQLARIVEMLG
jgi:hypothetical protein